MSRPVVIVNPLSSGVELAPSFKARGVPAIAVTLNYLEWPEFGSRIRASDFAEIIPNQTGIVSLLKKHDPIAIIPGTEEAIPLAEQLTAALTPQYANAPGTSVHRSHKALMQRALEKARVPALKTLHTASEHEAETWIRESELRDCGLVIKPPSSSGSDKVFHIPPNGDWRSAFNRILAEPVLSGARSETAVIQEQAVGTEFAVGTVSSNGRHFLAHLIKYHKTACGDRRTVFDHVEFVPFEDEVFGDLFEYTKKSLDALGIRWGAAHNEIILTKKGPRLIESSARMIGGPVVEFAREATGSSQADRLVELYVDGDIVTKKYEFKKTVMPVFLKAGIAGKVANVEALEGVSRLPTFLSRHIWIKNGDHVPQTVDYLTAIGIVALAGDRERIQSDYEQIRAMESGLVFQ